MDEVILDGYSPLLIDMRKAMWLSVWLLLGSLFAGVCLMLLFQGSSAFNRFVLKEPTTLIVDMIILSVLIFAGIFVHELVHGLTWMAAGRKGWKKISFGVYWKFMAPYCHCKEPLSCRTYVIGALAPLAVLGLIPFVASLLIGDLLLMVLGTVFISAAAGDVSIAWALREVPSDVLVLDHPTLPGCLVKES